MDDYNLSTLIESKNEWAARLLNILTPCIVEGIKSIFNEGYKMCIENDEEGKYLMTFQNLLNNIPKWSSQIVEEEKNRIEASSGCNYLEDLITCIHISQLKSLTSTRVGIKQKKVDIEIPNLNSFIHKVYINVARKLYVNVYLLERDIMPLQTQKNNREIEIIIKECILNSIRDNIPIENILKTYLDETQETGVEIEEKKEVLIDKEELLKRQKEERDKELESIKTEVKNKLEKESQDNLKKALMDANKLTNIDNLDTDKLNIDNLETENKLQLDDKLQIDDKLDIRDELNNNELIKIDKDNIINNLDLDIKPLDNDPDKLDMDLLNLEEKDGNIDNIELDIEELK
tara:strand:- start:1654 stop:2691 length:1038 start_codon:yes stop_codon:yes gene_type:complete